MAFVPKDPNLEDENATQASEPQTLSPESNQLGSGGGNAVGTPGGKATPQNRTASSSGFTNLNKYIGANQPQAAKLGGQIQSKIGESINSAADQASSVDKGYAEKVNPGQYSFDAKSFDPMKVDQSKFKNLFQAPTSTFNQGGEVDNAKKAIDTANTKVAQTQTIGGRKDLLGDQQTLSKAQGLNTAGMRSFDNLLLQSSEEGKASLDATRGDLENAGLSAKLQAAQDRAQAVDNQAKANQLSASSAARDALTSNNQALGSSLDQRAAAERAKLSSQNEMTMDKVRTFQPLSNVELSQLGMTSAQWDQARSLAKQNPGASPFAAGSFNAPADGGWNVNPYMIDKGSMTNLGRQNVMTSDDIARSQALAELGGIAGVSGISALSGAPQAFNRDVADFDIEKLLADLTPAQAETVKTQLNVPVNPAAPAVSGPANPLKSLGNAVRKLGKLSI